jgi:hypothetical protein
MVATLTVLYVFGLEENGLLWKAAADESDGIDGMELLRVEADAAVPNELRIFLNIRFDAMYR